MANIGLTPGTTAVGTLLDPHVDALDSYEYKGAKTKPAYKATLMWTEADQDTPAFKAMTKSITAEVTAHYKPRPVPNGFQWPWSPAEDFVTKKGEQRPGGDVKNGIWAKFSSQYDITVLGPMGSDDVIKDPERIRAEFYAGARARVVYSPVLYPDMNKGAVLLHLEQIQKAGVGTRIGGGKTTGIKLDAVDIGDIDPMAD